MFDGCDKTLVCAYFAGDATAFDRIIRRYGSSLLGYLTKMTGSQDKAEDLFQETFKRACEKMHTFSGDSLRPWLFTIATRLAIDDFKKRKNRAMVSLNKKNDCTTESLTAVAVDDSPGPLAEAIRTEQARHVRQAIQLLPARQKATLVLAYYQQLSYSEVAKVLNCSLGTVKTQMFRALKTLAKKLPDISGDTT